MDKFVCPLTNDEFLLFLVLRLHLHFILLPDIPIDNSNALVKSSQSRSPDIVKL